MVSTNFFSAKENAYKHHRSSTEMYAVFNLSSTQVQLAINKSIRLEVLSILNCKISAKSYSGPCICMRKNTGHYRSLLCRQDFKSSENDNE